VPARYHPDVPLAERRAVLLVRHAETDWNATRTCQGQLDAPRLTEQGRHHAAEVAHTLRDRVDVLIASDLTRARETAAIMSGVCGAELVGVDARLRERSFGVLEGGSLDAMTPAVTGIAAGTVVDAGASPLDGESLDELFARCAAWARDCGSIAPGRRLCVVTHGGTIRALRALAAGTAMSGLEWDAVANCSTWSVELPYGQVPRG
jgi:probable phosphoglycerate mutase